MGFCSNCGAKIAANAKFCSGCGATVNAQATPQSATPVNASPLQAVPAQPEPAVPVVPQSVLPVYQPPVQTVYSAPEKKDGRKFRHGFTTFYLWLTIISNGLGFFFVIIDFAMDSSVLAGYLPGLTTFDKWVIRTSVLFTFWSFWSIKNWQKSGFGTYAVVMIATAFLNPTKTGIIVNLITAAVSIGILYGVLHFCNPYNANSTWEQLE
jgi:hypothetical protein